MDKLFTLLGLGVPFYLAAGTYAVFAWLDSNASDEATKVISSWLHGRSQNKPDLGNLIINAFDRIYTSPLLTFRAFRRSTAVSMIVWLLVFFIPWVIYQSRYYNYSLLGVIRNFWSDKFLLPDVAMNLAVLVVVDYMSLFFVRKFLDSARRHPIFASLASSLIGFIVLIIGYFVLTMFSDAYMFSHIGIAVGFDIDTLISLFRLALGEFFFLKITGSTAGMAPALVIHLWLPLFALSTLIARLVFWIFRAVEKAQWFLKQGDAHPLKAIGIIATIIVFGSAMLVKEGWALLSVLERS